GIYTALRKYKENPDNHMNITNKLDKILSNFEKLFSTAEVKEFVDKLREEQEERGFETALQINVASACAIKALKGYRMNQTVINELKNNKCEEGPSKTKSMKRKNNLNEEDASSEIENSSEYDERPNKIKKQATNGIEEVISSSGASDKSNEESFDKKQADTIPKSVRDWIINVLSSGKDVFKNSIITSLIPDHKFRKICEIILYDFFSMASKNPLNRYIGERKYTVERIVPLFKAIQSVYKEFMFDWIEVQLNCIKDMKTLFPNFDMTLNKADGVCLKVSSNKEVVFIEIAGGPEVTSAVVKHAKEDTEKLIKEAMFGLVSLLRNYLDKNVDKAMKICTYMVQVIGDRITLSELCLNKKHSYMVSQVKSAMLPFSFDEIEKFLEVFELLHALINRLEEQINELKKLMLSNIIEEEPTIRDWIWVPNSITEWE
ncbi:28809_t:CDS:2, partial [Racocetra persica]